MAKKSLEEVTKELQAARKERDKAVERVRELKAQEDELVAAEQADTILSSLSPGQIDAVAKAAAVRVKGNGQEAGA